MAIRFSPRAIASTVRKRGPGHARLILLLVLLVLAGLCLIFSWATRDAMAHLPFLAGRGGARRSLENQRNLVDLSSWQTAQALAPLAFSAEEGEYAREAEHLADHEVDQAFALALRRASNRHVTLSDGALALSRRVAQFQQTVKQDQALVQSLSAQSKPSSAPGAKNSQPVTGTGDLEIAKAQLGLDSDELSDAQRDLARATDDQRARIQQELAAHEASMRKYDAESQNGGQIALLSMAHYGTLFGRVRAWFHQRSRYQLIQQALRASQADAAKLIAEHNVLEAQAGPSASSESGADNQSRLAGIKSRSAQNQVLSIYDDLIQTQQQLAADYGKWSAQVLLQNRIVLHLILRSLAWIAFMLIGLIVSDMLVDRLLERPALDQRRMQTLRTILKVGIQALGAVVVLLVIFGTPRQMPTILGLTTAGLTVALQDFILAFVGWFVLIGKNGIRVGDWVEINGVGGEAVEIGLFRTTLLETGNWTDMGHPTGRRVTFLNSYAIRGQYFNFSTSGQWMWDEISLSMPASADLYERVELIHQVVLEETTKDTQLAEQEWKRATRQIGVKQFSADPSVSLRPSGSGVDIRLRYVTRASDRFDVRNCLYRRLMDVLHKPNALALAGQERDDLVQDAR